MTRPHASSRFRDDPVYAMHTVWIHVVVNGRKVYWGPISEGASRKWTGSEVEIAAHHGNDFHVRVNGTKIGLMSQDQGHVAIVANPFTWHRVK